MHKNNKKQKINIFIFSEIITRMKRRYEKIYKNIIFFTKLTDKYLYIIYVHTK